MRPTSSRFPSTPYLPGNAADAPTNSACKPAWQQFSQAVVNGSLQLRAPLSDESMQDLADWLASSPAELKSLDVSQDAQLSTGGMQALFKALKANTTLKTLEIFNNRMDESSAEALAEMLRVNNALDALSLRSCDIDEHRVAPLSEAVKVNDGLKKLDLRHNTFGDEGLIALSEALMVNTKLTHLDVNKSAPGECDPCFFDTGMATVVNALKNNRTLTEIKLGSVEMKDATRAGLSSAVHDNEIVQVIGFYDSRFPKQDLQLLKSWLARNVARAMIRPLEPGALEGLRAMAAKRYPDEVMDGVLNALIKMPSIPADDRMTTLRSLVSIDNEEAAAKTSGHAQGNAPGS